MGTTGKGDDPIGLQSSGDVETDLAEIAHCLPSDTAQSWRTLLPAIPRTAYLAGGTALAVHLRHRISRDLDVFLEEPFNPEQLARILTHLGPFTPTGVAERALNGIFSATKVQFLEALRHSHLIEPLAFAGMRIASPEDLLAMKLKVIGDRAEMRDYFDVMVIEQKTDLSVEQGLAFFVERYRPLAPDSAVDHIVRGLGYLDDVGDDPGVPVEGSVVREYWESRSRQVLRHTS